MEEQKDEDREIIADVIRGNKEMFSKIVMKYTDRIFALAYTMIGNYHTAQDLTQEVFLKAYQALYSLKDISSFNSWLYKIATNTCREWLRKNKKYKKLTLFGNLSEVESAVTNVFTGGNHMENKELFNKVENALNNLSSLHREVAVLRFMENKSYKEIAEVVGSTPNSIAEMVFRIRKSLRDEMKNFL